MASAAFQTDSPGADADHAGGGTKLLQMPLFIAGIARSGSTMLANLLTSPPDQLVLVEPGVTRSDVGEHVRRELEGFGWFVSAAEWSGVPDESAGDRFVRVLVPRLAALKKWGVKEVNPHGWRELLELYRPAHVVLMVRSLEDAAVSMLEKEERADPPRKSADWMFERLDSAAKALVRLAQDLPASRLTTVRYEEFVRSAGYRESLALRLEWNLDGDPGQRLELYGRTAERDKHGGVVTALSIGRAARGASAEKRAFAARLRAENDEYARLFDYA